MVAPLSQILQIAQGGTTTNYLYGLNRLAAVSGGTHVSQVRPSILARVDDVFQYRKINAGASGIYEKRILMFGATMTPRTIPRWT